MNDTYLNGLLHALEKLNIEDNEKVQKIFRFWFGSPYLDLSKYNAAFSYGNKKVAFEAHTCSFELVIPNPQYYPDIRICEEKSTEFMLTLIENTLRNQELADENNLQTQYR